MGAVKSRIHILLRDSQMEIKPQYSNPKPCMIAAVRDATSWGLAMFGYAGVLIVPGAMHLGNLTNGSLKHAYTPKAYENGEQMS